MPGAKKIATRKAGAAVAPPPMDTDSESDAPEEFTKAEARDQALQQRKEERHIRTEQQRQLKQRRRDRESARTAHDQDGDEDEDAEGTAGRRPQSTQRGQVAGPRSAVAPDAEVDEDLLPESVLQAVAAKEEQVAAAAAAAAEAAAVSQRALRRAAKRQRLQATRDGVVAVQVLSKLGEPQAPGGNFRREALYGGRIKRSVEMLTKAKGRPAGKFV